MKEYKSNSKRFRPKLHVKKGDTVLVLSGANKGKQGRVLAVFPKKNNALVEGANIVHRHTKPNAANPDGGIVKKEAPIHLSNLMNIDPKSGDPTRIGRREENGKIVRYAKRSGEILS